MGSWLKETHITSSYSRGYCNEKHLCKWVSMRVKSVLESVLECVPCARVSNQIIVYTSPDYRNKINSATHSESLQLPNQITERISKRHRVFPARGQSWNNKSQNRKSFKKLQVQIRVENDFSFQFLRETKEVETLGEKWWSKQSYLATSREDVREAHTILASWFTNSLVSSVQSSNDCWCLNSK